MSLEKQVTRRRFLQISGAMGFHRHHVCQGGICGCADPGSTGRTHPIAAVRGAGPATGGGSHQCRTAGRRTDRRGRHLRRHLAHRPDRWPGHGLARADGELRQPADLVGRLADVGANRGEGVRGLRRRPLVHLHPAQGTSLVGWPAVHLGRCRVLCQQCPQQHRTEPGRGRQPVHDRGGRRPDVSRSPSNARTASS